jgi:heptosyltransferase-2
LPNWVGDVIHGLPALDAIRSHFNEAEITALGRGEVGTLLKDQPVVDRVISYRGRPGDFLPLWRVAASLRTQAFDLGLLLTRSFEGAWIFFLAGIPRRCGYATDGQKWLLTDPVPYTQQIKKLHQADYYLNLLFQMGIKGCSSPLHLVPGADEREVINKRLSAAGWSQEKRLIALCPGASYGPAKRWPANRFSDLAKLLIATQKVTVVLLGGREEQDLANEFPEANSGQLINLMGQTTLREAMALLAGCDVVVANDSGLLHLAVAVGTPAIALFGPTDPDRTGPKGEDVTVLRKQVVCSPCRMRECPIDHCCMERISVGEVYDAVVKSLVRTPSSPRAPSLQRQSQ